MTAFSIVPTIGVISIGTPWFDVATARRHLDETRVVLNQLGTVVGPEDVIVWEQDLAPAVDALASARPDVLILQIGTFPIGDAPAALAQALHVPIVVHSLPEPDLDRVVGLNSLCGANLASFTLTALESPYTWVHGEPSDPKVVRMLEAQMGAVRALKALRETRLHLIGFRAPGFYPCVFDELLLRRLLGVGIDHIGLQALAAELEGGATQAYSGPSRLPAIGGGTLPAEAKPQMERYYGALSAVLESNGTRVAAIKDWPEFYDDQAAGGFWPALGWIQDDGVVLAVEGDVNGAVTMAVEHAMTGGVPFLADISAWDDADSTLLLWHYGGAPSLARNPDEIRYGEEGHEVEFTLRPGLATLARLGLHSGRLRLLTIAVEILDKGVTVRRAAGHAKTLSTPAGEVVARMITEGWEHHVHMIYGDVREEFRAVSRFTGIPLVEL